MKVLSSDKAVEVTICTVGLTIPTASYTAPHGGSSSASIDSTFSFAFPGEGSGTTGLAVLIEVTPSLSPASTN